MKFIQVFNVFFLTLKESLAVWYFGAKCLVCQICLYNIGEFLYDHLVHYLMDSDCIYILT